MRYLAPGTLWAAVGFLFAVPLLIWDSDKAPEFYGSFTAAIVAAVAVIAATYFQAELTRRRDDEIAKREAMAQATDMFLWLEHAAREMDFVQDVLLRMRARLIADDTGQLAIPLEQFREIISARFFDEFRARIAMASRLPSPIAKPVTRHLYRAYQSADR